MNNRSILAFLILWLAMTAPVLAVAPSDKSVEEFLQVMKSRELCESMKGQVRAMLATTVRDAERGKTLTPERQAVIDRMQVKMGDLIDQTLDFDALRPMYLRIYQESFTQDELNGIIKFYKTPAGQAMVNKMPAAMQNVMTEMQGVIKPMQIKIQQIQQQAFQELEALKDPP